MVCPSGVLSKPTQKGYPEKDNTNRPTCTFRFSRNTSMLLGEMDRRTGGGDPCWLRKDVPSKTAQLGCHLNQNQTWVDEGLQGTVPSRFEGDSTMFTQGVSSSKLGQLGYKYGFVSKWYSFGFPLPAHPMRGTHQNGPVFLPLSTGPFLWSRATAPGRPAAPSGLRRSAGRRWPRGDGPSPGLKKPKTNSFPKIGQGDHPPKWAGFAWLLWAGFPWVVLLASLQNNSKQRIYDCGHLIKSMGEMLLFPLAVRWPENSQRRSVKTIAAGSWLGFVLHRESPHSGPFLDETLLFLHCWGISGDLPKGSRGVIYPKAM